MRRKLLSDAERSTHKSVFVRRMYPPDTRIAKVLQKNAEDNWIEGIKHILDSYLWKVQPRPLTDLVLGVAASHDHVKLMKMAINYWHAGEFRKSFHAACNHGRLRAMIALRPWLKKPEYLCPYINDGYSMALWGDQPAVILLMKRWTKKSDSDLKIMLYSELLGIFPKMKRPRKRVRKLIKRWEWEPICV